MHQFVNVPWCIGPSHDPRQATPKGRREPTHKQCRRRAQPATEHSPKQVHGSRNRRDPSQSTSHLAFFVNLVANRTYVCFAKCMRPNATIFASLCAIIAQSDIRLLAMVDQVCCLMRHATRSARSLKVDPHD